MATEIQSICARVATEPSGDFHFHRGPAFLRGTSKEGVAKKYGVLGVNVYASNQSSVEADPLWPIVKF